MAKTVNKKNIFSNLSLKEVFGGQSKRFFALFILAVYTYAYYLVVTYINDINKVEECSKILPLQKNVLYSYGILYLSLSVFIVISMILLLLFILYTFVFSKKTIN